MGIYYFEKFQINYIFKYGLKKINQKKKIKKNIYKIHLKDINKSLNKKI